eukprot:gb/GECG01014836.1/.p1 GENE.gb/GECG01014836.1/~~gb/GECG01014836.1/.p1  ORF type:complete len:207 (+),score=12.20 gb/GECG01014836.1/:1-621(+)
MNSGRVEDLIQTVVQWLQPYQRQYGAIARDYLPLALLAIASLRMLAVFLGLLAPGVLFKQVYPNVKDTGNLGVGARLFSAWTMLTCMLATFCALNPDNGALYLATFLSFVTANALFTLELCLGTMTFGTFLRPAFFATTAIALMILAWPPQGIQMNLTKCPSLPTHLVQILQHYASIYGIHLPGGLGSATRNTATFEEADAVKGEL